MSHFFSFPETKGPIEAIKLLASINRSIKNLENEEKVPPSQEIEIQEEAVAEPEEDES